MNQVLISLIIVIAVVAAIYGAIKFAHFSFGSFILTIAGMVVGLMLGAFLYLPLSRLPNPYGDVLPTAASLIITVAVVSLFLNKRDMILGGLPQLRAEGGRPGSKPVLGDKILVDTSVIIDGRIADIARAGFVRAKLLVPRFVLAELQNIADSDDAMRRGRGRRGLEMLNNIRATEGVDMEVIEEAAPEIKEVDAKLVSLAHRLGADILTTDYNLNRVAQIEGVRVLNINELSNAIRPVVLPGEEMTVKVVQPGKERGQGVGYLPDGTMIVVEQGDRLIGQEVPTEVTRVFQTVAGKMIFAVPKNRVAGNGGGDRNRGGRKPRRPQNQPPANHQPIQPASPAQNPSRPQGNSPGQIEERLVRDNTPQQ